jgi:hypothetical protein
MRAHAFPVCKRLTAFASVVWSLIGLGAEAAKQALAGLLAGNTLSGNQIELVTSSINSPTTE